MVTRPTKTDDPRGEDGTWPSHGHRIVPWRMSGRGPRADRMVREVEVSMPPFIAGLDLRVSKSTELAVHDATAAISALDAGPGVRLSALGGFLLRSESVSSSRIEHVSATRDDFAKAVFTDGNGRVVRASISAVIRRRRLANRTVVPVASAMLADTTTYFQLVANYRNGAADDFVRYLADSAIAACQAGMESAASLEMLPQQWRDMAHPRKSSADEKIIDRLLERPILGVHGARDLAGSSYSSANQALERLTEAGVLAPLDNRARDRVWMATEVLDEIDRMNERIGQRIAHPE